MTFPGKWIELKIIMLSKQAKVRQTLNVFSHEEHSLDSHGCIHDTHQIHIHRFIEHESKKGIGRERKRMQSSKGHAERKQYRITQNSMKAKYDLEKMGQ